MTENLNNSEGFNYSPEIDVKDSNVDPKIEEIEVRVNKTKDTRKIRLLKNLIKYFYDASILNKSIYLEKTDSKNIPFIKHIEKYPDLPEDVFIPIEFDEIDENKYFINKSGEVYSVDLGILNGTVSSYGYLQQSLTNKSNEVKTYFSHRLTALTFIYNPDPNIYTLVNHIDSNKKNCNVSNLEWVTVSGNNLKKNIKTYTKQDINSLIGFSGNVNDYKWMEHWKYPRIYVCKEGFIMYNSKRVGSMTSTYKYIHIKILNKNGVICDGYAQRIIMEYIMGRDLLPEEEVDHINTIPYDNSFSNLKLTNHKGNMNNQLTIEKRYKRIVLADLYGDFYKYDTVKSIQEEITGRKINRENLRSSSNIISQYFFYDTYIVIYPEDKDTLIKKMKKVVYVFNNDKTKILGAFIDCVKAGESFGLSTDSVCRSTKKNKAALDGNYYMRGEEAVKLVLSLGHGTAANFKPEEIK